MQFGQEKLRRAAFEQCFLFLLNDKFVVSLFSLFHCVPDLVFALFAAPSVWFRATGCIYCSLLFGFFDLHFSSFFFLTLTHR